MGSIQVSVDLSIYLGKMDSGETLIPGRSDASETPEHCSEDLYHRDFDSFDPLFSDFSSLLLSSYRA